MTFEFKQHEAALVEFLTDELVQEYNLPINDPEYLRQIKLSAHELPMRLRSYLLDFQQSATNGLLLLRGLLFDDIDLELTPNGNARSNTPKLDTQLLLLTTLFLDVFSWQTYLDGDLVHNLAPKRENEGLQTSEGSIYDQLLHTEEAFHEHRPDAFALMAVRNPDNGPTKFVQWHDLDIPGHIERMLRQPNYVIKADEANVAQDSPRSPVITHRLRFDPAYTICTSLEAKEALEFMHDEANSKVQEISLNPGDVILVNNEITLHGRKGFQPRYDGKDRWLKRVWLTRDLGRTRHLRATPESRLLP